MFERKNLICREQKQLSTALSCERGRLGFKKKKKKKKSLYWIESLLINFAPQRMREAGDRRLRHPLDR